MTGPRCHCGLPVRVCDDRDTCPGQGAGDPDAASPEPDDPGPDDDPYLLDRAQNAYEASHLGWGDQ